MFEAIVPVDTLEDALGPVDALVAEARINLETEGIEIRAVDPANVAMVEMHLDASAFETYGADGGLIAINVEQFLDVISLGDSGDLVHLELDAETRKLHIQINGLEYTQSLIDPDSVRQEPELPDKDLRAEVVLEGGDLDWMIDAADLCSDHIAFAADPESEVFYMEAEGDTDDTTVEYGPDDLIDADVSDDARSLYSLDYINDITQPIDDETEVTVTIGDEFPINLAYERVDGRCSVRHMVAPRVGGDT